MQQVNEAASTVPATAKQEADSSGPRAWTWVEAEVWTDRMLAALENGVTGGRWYSLMDTVYAPCTLEAAWKRVAANRGAAGVDRVSVQRLARQAHAIWLSWPRSFGTGVTGPTLSAVCLFLKDRDAPGH